MLKKGDRVRIIALSDSEYGKLGTVIRVRDHIDAVRVDIDNGPADWLYYGEEVERVIEHD